MDERQRYALVAAFLATPPSVGFLVFFAMRGEPGRSVGVAVSAAFVAASALILVTEAVLWISKREPRELLPGERDFVKATRAAALFARRRYALPHIQDALLEQARSGQGRILMCGVCLRHFFQESYAPDFVPRFITYLCDGGAELVAAVLDPSEDEAKRRSLLENLEESGRTVEDIEETIRVFEQEQLRQTGRFSLAVYKLRPFLFAVVTPSRAFVQRYISAPPRNRTDLWAAGRGRCYGDFENVMEYPRQSDQYPVIQFELLDMFANDCRWRVGQPPSWVLQWRRNGQTPAGHQ